MCVCVDFVVVVDVVLGGSRKYTPIMGLTERPSLGKKKIQMPEPVSLTSETNDSRACIQ